MKAFVSGVAGLIGSNLAKQLLDRRVQVVGCDDLSGGYSDNVPDGIQFHEIDCSSSEVRAHLKNCQVVFHCAAHAYEGLSIFSPSVVVRSIMDTTSNLISAAITSKVSKIVFCSSMARYGRQRPPFDETMPVCPVDPYGIAKVAAEQLIISLCQFHGVRYTIVVPHNVFGVGQRYDDPYRNVIGIMLNRMLQGMRPIIYGDGTQARSFTPIYDAVAPLLAAGLSEAADGLVVNVGAGPEDAMSMISLVDRINRILGTNLEPIHIEGRPNEIASAFCTNDLSQRVLNCSPICDIGEEIEKMVKWVRRRGTRPFRYDKEIEIASGRGFSAWRDRLL